MSRTLSPAAATALRAATADDRSVTLAPGQLERPVYVEVNKVLERIAGGGKWNRKAKAHLFGQDPRPELAALLGDGQGGDAPVAMPVDRDREASFWRTPPAVVERMLRLAGIDDLPVGSAVLEPSAGDGAIAGPIRSRRPDIDLVVVEPDVGRARTLSQTGPVVPTTFETMAAQARARGDRFDAIVMNPPFTLPGNRQAWATHIELALDLLAGHGTLVAVVPCSYETSSIARVRELRAFIEGELGGTYEPLADDAFRESGTGVRTGLLVIDGSAR